MQLRTPATPSAASSPVPDSTEDRSPRFRSAAVARMTGIAVATLRVWERRYRVVAPPQSATGHRLYSSENVRRLGLIRALIDQGHTIGTLAPLDDAALQRLLLAAAPEFALPSFVAAPADAPPAAQALTGLGETLDVLAVELDTLNADHADRLLALRSRVSARQTLVVYGFGSEVVVQRLRRQGITVWRGPMGRAEMALLLRTVLGVATSYTAATSAEPQAPRLSPEALALAARSTSRVLCECPRHLAELVQLLGDFEDYSGQCAVDSPADRQLHDDLGAAARHARGAFEQALRRLAAAEGWSLQGPAHASLGAR
jgi:DNA-binding transcriptional MerR regulator